MRCYTELTRPDMEDYLKASCTKLPIHFGNKDFSDMLWHEGIICGNDVKVIKKWYNGARATLVDQSGGTIEFRSELDEYYNRDQVEAYFEGNRIWHLGAEILIEWHTSDDQKNH